MEVRTGCNRTEAGVIPEDGEIISVLDVALFVTGDSRSWAKYYPNQGELFVRITNHTRESIYLVLQDCRFVNLPTTECEGKHLVVINKRNLPFISGLHTIVAKEKTEEVAHDYRRYCFQTRGIQQQFLFYAVGTKVSGISKTNIPKLTLPVPLLPEQTAIAAILTDMDAEPPSSGSDSPRPAP